MSTRSIANLRASVAAIKWPRCLDSFINLIESCDDLLYVHHQIGSVPDFAEFIIGMLEGSPDGLRSDDVLPTHLTGDARIAAMILTIVHLYGYTNYTLRQSSAIENFDKFPVCKQTGNFPWELIYPERISDQEFAEEIEKLCKPSFDPALYIGNAYDNHDVHAECSVDSIAITMKPGAIYSGEVLRAELKKLGMMSSILGIRLVLIGETPDGIVSSIIISPAPEVGLLPADNSKISSCA